MNDIIPNLPQKKISRMFCACNIDKEIEYSLERLNIILVRLSGLDVFDEPVRNHPDMLCFHIGGTKWVFYEAVYKKNRREIDKLNLDIILANNPHSGEYPCNIALNAASVGSYLICAEKYTHRLIHEHFGKSKIFLNVKQGYAKCSVCIVDGKSVITSDMSIYKACIQNKIEVLLIRGGHIDLHGYNYGFIGGCSGLTDKSTLVFTGNIKMHPDYDDIKKFCECRGVEIISLSQKKLYDYGSLLPII